MGTGIAALTPGTRAPSSMSVPIVTTGTSHEYAFLIWEANADSSPVASGDEAWAASGVDGAVSGAGVGAASGVGSAGAGVSWVAGAGASTEVPAASSWARSASAFARAASASAALAAASAAARRALRSAMFSLMVMSFGLWAHSARRSRRYRNSIPWDAGPMRAIAALRAVAPSTGGCVVSRLSTGGGVVSRLSTGRPRRQDTGSGQVVASRDEPSTLDRSPQDGGLDQSRVRQRHQRRR